MNGKVIVDPTAESQEAGLEIDSNEYIQLLKMLERDPNGTKTKINECIGSNKEITSIVNEII